MILSEQVAVACYSLKSSTVKVDNYFPVYDKSNNFRQGKKYGMDRLRQYDFRAAKSIPSPPCLETHDFPRRSTLILGGLAFVWKVMCP